MNKNEITEKQQENRREDKKALMKFWPLMILCFIGGVGCGIAAVALGSTAEQVFWRDLREVLKLVSIYGSYVISGGFIAACVVLLRKSRREYTVWDEEDEVLLNKIEQKLSYVLWFSNLILYGAYFFFGVGVWACGISEGWQSIKEVPMARLILVFVHMIGSLIVACIIQQHAINLEKEINPEKSGSVYDTKFSSKWLESCDEAEKYTTYKCSYKSHRITNLTVSMLWVICLIGQMTFHTGVFATVVVSVIMLVQISVYSLQAIYFAKHPSEVMK